MQPLTWDTFSAFFAAQENQDARQQREHFLRQHAEWEGEASEREDYHYAFLGAYGIHIDWKEGTFSLLGAIAEQLGDAEFSIEFDDDREVETATVAIAGNQHQFHHHQMGSDGFNNEWERIEHLLAQNGYGLRFYVGNGISDTMSFLLLPASEWAQAEQQYGAKGVEEYFVVYGSTYYVPELDADMIAGNKRKSKTAAAYSFEDRMMRLALWCVLPVLGAFALYVLWGLLFGGGR